MRALILTCETPVPPHGGYRLRVLHLARQLALRCDVDVAALGAVSSGDLEPFSLVGLPHEISRTRAFASSLTRPYLAARFRSQRLEELAAERRWDVVQVESPWLLREAAAAGVPVVLDAHNVEVDIAETLSRTDPRLVHRLRWRWEAAKVGRAERDAVRAAAAVAACSEADAEAFRSMGAERVVVVPNGVDADANSHGLPAAEPVVAFVGQFGYRPNEAAAIELVEQILPRVRRAVSDARVLLIGREPGEAVRALAGPTVTVAADVPEVLPLLRQARLLLVPLRAGSGTRLKILEAMAAGVPVVTTGLGVAGIDARPGTEMLLGETPDELAEQAIAVLRDGQLAESLSRSARSLVEERYDWQITARPLLELYEDLRGGGT